MKIEVTSNLIKLFHEKKIFFTTDDTDSYLTEGSVLEFRSDLEIEAYSCFFEAGFSLISMGAFSYVRSVFPLTTKIGRYCAIAYNIDIMGPQHPTGRFTISPITYRNAIHHKAALEDFADERRLILARFNRHNLDPITIGNDVWLGSDLLLKPGIIIGDGAVVAAGSIVNKDVPPYAIVGGVPAKIIRYRFADNVIERLIALRWWDYNAIEFNVKSDASIDEFIDTVGKQISEGEISKFEPRVLTGTELSDYL
jgi:acetyltransferase-like isoleucine patch superfamily enzyme